MTKILAVFMSGLFWVLTALLPRWKRLTARVRLYNRLQQFEEISIGSRTLKLFIPDRTCVYWAKKGPTSEPMTNAWIGAFSESDTFLDIGANVGLYSMMAVHSGIAKVYAVEPNPFSFSVLARNIVENDMGATIVPICMALDTSPSLVPFSLSSTHAGTVHNEIATGGDSGSSIALTMTALSVDAWRQIYDIPAINHLKIDVDGFEFSILRGAEALLSDDELKTLLVEDNFPDSAQSDEMIAFIEAHGLHRSDVWEADGTPNMIFVRDGFQPTL